ncbi:hypothetical protein F2P47_17425 [Parvibaculum sedimenti]|uniref:ATP synthase subunit I n=1 Tax=Parvibaculum sedimenti TaxID=2608632 RepID=A0A6N6VDZ4_9HYPH|nr:ATP synthase subunit I [Parvibaculum sedimenti]KAB7738398.1 hypothetical protein F2P47_17425 [Parvibaculum sedimenti]
MHDGTLASAIPDFLRSLGPLGGGFIGLMAGVLLGFFHFRSLWWNTQVYMSGGNPFRALALQLFRFAVLIALLVGLAKLGALPLLAGALGLLLARSIVFRHVGGAS